MTSQPFDDEQPGPFSPAVRLPAPSDTFLDPFNVGERNPTDSATRLTAWSKTSASEAEADTDSPQARSSPTSSSSHLSEPSSKISRKRLRPRLDLAPGQPPTVRGNDRIRVYVACHPCRARKIRCDGAKPICSNCQRRSPVSNTCDYEVGPKRRGRQKGTGSTRSQGPAQKGEKPPRRKPSPIDVQTQSESDTSLEAEGRLTDHGAPLSMQIDDPFDADFDTNTFLRSVRQTSYASDMFDYPNDMAWDVDPMLYGADSLLDVPQSWHIDMPHIPDPAIVVTPPEQESAEEQDSAIPSRPSTRFARDTWWDALLTLYATDFTQDSSQAVSLTNDQRSATMKLMVLDLRALFQVAPCWLGFLHLPRFFETLYDPARRNSLQPSFLMIALALGKLEKSSIFEDGARGRERAMTLMSMAQGALEGSLATGWVDMGLSYASLLLVYFEMHSHPLQSMERMRSALLLLDSLMRLFSLPALDEGIKARGRSPFADMRHADFNPTASPNFITPPSAHYGLQPGPSYSPHTGLNFPFQANVNGFDGAPAPVSYDRLHQSHPRGCSCLSMTLGFQWPAVKTTAPSWASLLMWPEGLSEADFRKEEYRRFTWSCVTTVASTSSYTSGVPESGADAPLGHLVVREPENFALLLPRESLALSGVITDVDDLPTLNLRATLLVHLVLRMREDRCVSPAERAQMAVQAWLEIDDIEARMARHTCQLQRVFGFDLVESLFMLRMLTSHEFQQYIPQITTNGSRLFYRDKAESWLQDMDKMADRIWASIGKGPLSTSQDHRKPLLIYWTLSSVRKAIVLWMRDNTLTSALTLACKFAERVEYGLLVWPGNPRVRQVWQKVRYRLVESCLKAGMPLPSPALPRLPPANTPTTATQAS